MTKYISLFLFLSLFIIGCAKSDTKGQVQANSSKVSDYISISKDESESTKTIVESEGLDYKDFKQIGRFKYYYFLNKKIILFNYGFQSDDGLVLLLKKDGERYEKKYLLSGKVLRVEITEVKKYNFYCLSVEYTGGHATDYEWSGLKMFKITDKNDVDEIWNSTLASKETSGGKTKDYIAKYSIKNDDKGYTIQKDIKEENVIDKKKEIKEYSEKYLYDEKSSKIIKE